MQRPEGFLDGYLELGVLPGGGAHQEPEQFSPLAWALASKFLARQTGEPDQVEPGAKISSWCTTEFRYAFVVGASPTRTFDSWLGWPSMPNTLVHVGIQGLLTRAVAREADFKWVCLGCVIPDLPWILHRAVRLYGADVINSYDLRLYAVVQSSLFLSLVLCGSAAMFSSSPRRVFSLLSLNAVAHLVLDALETKWANGVLLFAPFSWQLLNVGLFWPDSGVIVAASVFGFGYLLYIWWSKPGKSIALSFDLGARAAVGCGLLAAYLLLPFFFVADSENANNHYVAVLRDRDHRTGKYVEFDKHYVVQTDENTILRTFGGEKLVLLGSVNASGRHISVRGRFVDNTTVRVEEVHLHSPGLREGASMVGLFLIAGLWLARGRRTRHSIGA